LTSLALRAERFETRFPAIPARDSDNVRVTAGVELQPRALISGTAFIGFRHLNPVDEVLLPEFKGFVSDLTLQYTLLGSTTFEVRHARDLVSSFEQLYPYYINTTATAGVRRALGRLFDVQLSGTRSTLAYRGLPDQTGARTDYVYSYGGSLGFRVGRNGRVGAGAVYTWRDSPLEDREYSGLRIQTTANYGF
jgi:hypothetical protein